MSREHKLPERELLEAARKGDAKARDSLIRASMWIVHAQAKKWRHDDFDELVQIALIGSAELANFGGLMRAIETFDPERGANFWSHATHWINSALQHSHIKSRRQKRRRDRTISIDDPEAGKLGVGGTKGSSAAKQITLHDLLAGPGDPEREADARRRLEGVRQLPPRERTVAEGRAQGVSHRELGEGLGCSRQNAQVIERNARKHLKEQEK